MIIHIWKLTVIFVVVDYWHLTRDCIPEPFVTSSIMIGLGSVLTLSHTFDWSTICWNFVQRKSFDGNNPAWEKRTRKKKKSNIILLFFLRKENEKRYNLKSVYFGFFFFGKSYIVTNRSTSETWRRSIFIRNFAVFQSASSWFSCAKSTSKGYSMISGNIYIIE